ncbi:MAG: CpaF family protein [Eggerthellaceae bacterium]
MRPYDTVRIVSAEGASAGEAFLETVCERARVVAVGDDATGVQSGSASVTVEVSPRKLTRCAKPSSQGGSASFSWLPTMRSRRWAPMDRTTERALKRAVRDEAAVRLRGDAVGSDAVEALIRRLVEEIATSRAFPAPVRVRGACECDDRRLSPLTGRSSDCWRTNPSPRSWSTAAASIWTIRRCLSRPIVYVSVPGASSTVPMWSSTMRSTCVASSTRSPNSRASDATTRTPWAARCCRGRARATYVVAYRAGRAGAQRAHVLVEHAGHGGSRAHGYADRRMAQFLRAAVQARCPLVISGGTGSGKTTLLGALSGFIPPDERVITIEDTPELRLQTPHVERMQTREANTEGEGSVSMRELVALSLRRRPDRIIVGECRGAEAYDMLQAMQTDHPGSMTTVHANDPGNAISRLRTMVGYADGDLSRDAIVQQIAESLQGGPSCTSNACKTGPAE